MSPQKGILWVNSLKEHTAATTTVDCLVSPLLLALLSKLGRPPSSHDISESDAGRTR
jgi:hypothetical protein